MAGFACACGSGHAESVRIEYDPSIVSYEEILHRGGHVGIAEIILLYVLAHTHHIYDILFKKNIYIYTIFDLRYHVPSFLP